VAEVVAAQVFEPSAVTTSRHTSATPSTSEPDEFLINMTLTLLESWDRIRAALSACAPLTDATVRAPAVAGAVSDAQSAMDQTFPDGLMTQLLLFDGLELNPVTGALLPPFFVPASLQRIRTLWQTRQANPPIHRGTSIAGAPCREFHPLLVPIAEDTTGDLLVTDNRPGKLQGCVLAWSKVDGFSGSPIWPSLEAMWADVARALETGTAEGAETASDPAMTRNGCAAVFTVAGLLEWEF
jgi:cell wall assembly regulator SMI1